MRFLSTWGIDCGCKLHQNQLLTARCFRFRRRRGNFIAEPSSGKPSFWQLPIGCRAKQIRTAPSCGVYPSRISSVDIDTGMRTALSRGTCPPICCLAGFATAYPLAPASSRFDIAAVVYETSFQNQNVKPRALHSCCEGLTQIAAAAGTRTDITLHRESMAWLENCHVVVPGHPHGGGGQTLSRDMAIGS
jgi:hypothetical protein